VDAGDQLRDEHDLALDGEDEDVGDQELGEGDPLEDEGDLGQELKGSEVDLDHSGQELDELDFAALGADCWKNDLAGVILAVLARRHLVWDQMGDLLVQGAAQ